MGETRERLATSAALLRAAELGRQVDEILGDIGLQKLSKAAWLALAAELASGADLAELRVRIEGLPYLNRLVHMTASRWARDQQDRPVADPIFGNGSGELAASYAERLMGQLSIEACSAIVAAIVAETAPPERWGRLGSFDEVQALLEPLERELLELDDQLARTLLVADLAWEAGKATLRAGAVSVALDAASAARPASALAEAARNAARGLAIAV